MISFIDIYQKVARNFPEARTVSKNDRLIIGKAFIEIAKRYGMTIRPCAEGTDLAPYGADCSGCMTVKTFETALHTQLDVPKEKKIRETGNAPAFLAWISEPMIPVAISAGTAMQTPMQNW